MLLRLILAMAVPQQREQVRKQCVYANQIQHVEEVSELVITAKIQDLEPKLDIGLAELGNLKLFYYI
jgi:hypothetical protein